MNKIKQGTTPTNNSLNSEKLKTTMREACKKIAPVWPLENFVAVNPYLGLIDKPFAEVAKNLAVADGVEMTLPQAYYQAKINEGRITANDLATVLKKNGNKLDSQAFLKQIANVKEQKDELFKVQTIASLASQTTQTDWGRFLSNRLSTWAAAYFDKGQAIWASTNKKTSIFESWKQEAEIDRSAEIAGLKGFRQAVKNLPNNALEATKAALELLEIPESAQPIYFHSLLLKMGGWAAYAAQLDWDNELYGGEDGKLIEFLAILLCTEAVLMECLHDYSLEQKWHSAKRQMQVLHTNKNVNEELTEKIILQEAFDQAAQRELIDKFRTKTASIPNKTAIKAQAIFCIDVRSEVYRRNLELVDNGIQTLGFAGFFAFPIKYVPLGHNQGEAQCPVLLKTGPTIMEEIADKKANQKAINDRKLNFQANQVWKSFKSGAVSCFSFVSPVGLSYLPKLFTDSFGLTTPVPHPDNAGLKKSSFNKKTISLQTAIYDKETTGIALPQQIQMAKNALKAMSLTADFAEFVLIVGHGSSSINNPYATGLDCGACGGHTGEANSKVAAAVLNNKEVRDALKLENINIPENTRFLACLHNTTTDVVEILNEDVVPANQHRNLNHLKNSLNSAGQAARVERSLRMGISPSEAIDKAVKGRSNDWSQTRPEWGLAGCSAFVVAPRERTLNINLEGRSFLHSYDWKQDEGFGILELIMTAPMVVTSWISLQYYASTVDNNHYGSGNKTLHNVTAGLGVLEGYAGDLRVGLPMQSVHDGDNYQHEPLKLNVCIEAPIDAMNAIIEKHESVRNLCDNGWLHLLAMDSKGKISHRYSGNLQWESVEG